MEINEFLWDSFKICINLTPVEPHAENITTFIPQTAQILCI